jgi:hypothetical protein
MSLEKKHAVASLFPFQVQGLVGCRQEHKPLKKILPNA